MTITTHADACVRFRLILPDCQYCVSSRECRSLEGWAWNGTCVFHCPRDYAERISPTATTCVYDPETDKVSTEDSCLSHARAHS